MTAALGTLVFLVTLWMLGVAGAAMLEKSGSRILAALKGDGPWVPMATVPVRVRARSRAQSATRVTPKLRAAA